MHFVIAGCITCPQFSYAVMVAQRLKEHLPDFTYLKIPKKPEDWNRWLVCICKQNNWHHIKSPIIWREIGLKKGKKDFIGDINTFLDLCYDYYGIPHDILSAEQFNRGEMNWFTNRTESEFFEDLKSEAKRRREYRARQVCITGAGSRMAEIIAMELLQIDLQKRENGLEIRLYDQPHEKCKLLSRAVDAKHCPGPSGLGNCRVATNLKEAFSNVDLVIVLDCFSRKTNESVVKWLKRNRNAMCALGKALNLYAPTHCRVIIGSPSTQPTCYNATVLAAFATRLHVRNIVVVTQDLGREALKSLSQKSGAPLRDFYCPPVWGFIGLNKYIDIPRTLQTHLYKVPGKRPNSTLPQGTEEYELRTSESLISEHESNDLLLMVREHKSRAVSDLGRWPCLAKVTAIVDLLKVWGLKQEDGNGEILSLGVYSDGTFNIPKGIYWSQPVILRNGFWVPFADFPIPRPASFDIHYLFLFSVASLYRTKVKPRMYFPPKQQPAHKETKKFNFDKLAEDVGMPVIKTDPECVVYLKNLTKKELGIDLDEVTNYIEEETEECEIAPTEEVIRKPVFCECWRQELKELQKLVFDRSSTTEVEVDLSENLSGSEWSIINPHSGGLISSSESANLPPGSPNQQSENSKESDLVRPSYGEQTSSSVVCSCGRLSTGSICQCLGPPHVKPPKVTKKEQESTEHYYKKQNAMIYEDDLTDAIYADTYESKEKRVSFDPDAKKDDLTGFQLKLYGRKDAVRDEEADEKMRKRILRYERGGEDSVEGEGEFTVGEGRKFTEANTPDSIGTIEESKEDSEEMDIKKESSTNIRNEFPQLIEPIDKSRESSERDLLYLGQYSFPEMLGEDTQYSLKSLEEDLDAVWNQLEYNYIGEYGGYGVQVDAGLEPEEPVEPAPKKTRRRREGVPLCCLCRCLVPEGLPCCPCGATTVVEVFRKESVEVLIQSEDDINYRVKYFQTPLPKEPDVKSEMSDAEEVIEEPLPTRELPPESFLPFFPKPVNVFKPAERPYELTKEYLDSFKKIENEIPPKCAELMDEAKLKVEEMERIEEVEEAEEEVEEEEEKENLPPICEEIEHIKADFSDLKLFIPCGVEDWRLTVQKKYREWFFQGSKIKDDSYYDVAIEEVSEDEFELDKELEQYFEK